MPYLRNFILAASAAAGVFAFGSQDSPLVLRSNTRVVEIPISVRDVHGHSVEGLSKDDFKVTDNGKPRPFSIFTVTGTEPSAAEPVSAPLLPPHTFTNVGQPTHAPSGHSTVILLDVVDGWFDSYAIVRPAILRIFDKLPADERIALYLVEKHRGLIILQDYTVDRKVLYAALDKYIPQWMCPAPVVGGPPPLCRNMMTMYWDVDSLRVAFDALAANLRRQPGRKSVFWISQGFPQNLLRGGQPWDDTIARLNDANVEVNSLDSSGLSAVPPYWGGSASVSLMALAERTGGTAFLGRNDFDVALMEGIANSRGGYMLGFYLTEADGRYHKLKVTVDRPGLQINHRQGYYATDQPPPDPSQKKTDASAALISQVDSTAVSISATLEPKPDSPPGTFNVRLLLGPDGLSLKPGKIGKIGTVKQMFIEWNAAGKILAQQSVTTKFEVDPPAEPRFHSRGMHLDQVLTFPESAARLSILVQDTNSGRTGSLTISLTPN